MSSQRGNSNRSRPQKHQNSHTFKNNMHDTSQRTKTVNQLEFGGLCQRCKDILEWKVRYKKYKVLSQPRKCVRCDRRCITGAYLIVCQQCALQSSVCQKCGQQRELAAPSVGAAGSAGAGGAAAAAVARSLESQMLQLRERDKRAFLRLLGAEKFATAAEAKAWIEARLNGGDGGGGGGCGGGGGSESDSSCCDDSDCDCDDDEDDDAEDADAKS